MMGKEVGKNEVSRLVGKFKKSNNTQSNNLGEQAANNSSQTTILLTI